MRDTQLTGHNIIVLVDKPFCPTTRECDELIDLAKSKNKILSIFHSAYSRLDLLLYFYAFTMIIKYDFLSLFLNWDCL